MVGEHVISFSSANWAAEVESSSVPVLVDRVAGFVPKLDVTKRIHAILD